MCNSGWGRFSSYWRSAAGGEATGASVSHASVKTTTSSTPYVAQTGGTLAHQKSGGPLGLATTWWTDMVPADGVLCTSVTLPYFSPTPGGMSHEKIDEVTSDPLCSSY